VRAWLPSLGVGASAERHDDAWEVGPAIRLGLPIFDQQQGPRRIAAAHARRARHEAAATEIELRSSAQQARTIAREAHAAALKLKDVVIPLRHQILDELVKHYDAMDASTFELLAARGDLVDAGHQYVDALLRYWSAMAQVTALRRGVDLEAAP
jgi:outer membrane protein TolC